MENKEIRLFVYFFFFIASREARIRSSVLSEEIVSRVSFVRVGLIRDVSINFSIDFIINIRN